MSQFPKCEHDKGDAMGFESCDKCRIAELEDEVKRLRGILGRRTDALMEACCDQQALADQAKRLQTIIAVNCDPTNATEEDAKVIRHCYRRWNEAAEAGGK